MNMHNEDIDALFRNKLNGLEMVPSANVWNNINAELNTGRKRRLVPVWSIAASVALLIAAGLFFIPREEVADANKPKQIAFKQPGTALKGTAKAEEPQPAGKEGSLTEQTGIKSETNYVAVERPVKAPKAITPEKLALTQPDPQIVNKPVEEQVKEQPVVLAVNTTEKPAITPVVPDDLSLKPETIPDAIATKPILANTESRTTAKAEKHRVHSLGDLINNVVGSIDKRKDKIIEFTDSDGDQANITGINLGIFRLKRTSSK